MRKDREALELQLAKVETALGEAEARFRRAIESGDFANSRIALMAEQAQKLEQRIADGAEKLSDLIDKIRAEETRYMLLETFFKVVAEATNEHYHTSNLPEHSGYIIRDEDMAQIRRLMGRLGVR